VTDALDQFGARRGRQLGQQSVPQVAVADPGADLDQFVVIERLVHLGDQVRGEAGIAYQHDRLAVVPEPTKVFALGGGEHEEEVVSG
jgi:hypothetical protein